MLKLSKIRRRTARVENVHASFREVHCVCLSCACISAWIGSLHLAFGYLLSPLGSYLSDRYSYRFTSALGNLAGMSGFLLASLSSKLWLMYLTYGFMSGCGHITSYNSCSLVVLQYFIKWRSLAVGIVQSSPAIGVLAVTQLTQAWLDEFGWRWAVRGLAGLYFICALCSAVFVPLDHPSEENNWGKDMIMKPPVEQTRRLSLLGNRPFLILLASVAVNHLANYVPIMHIVSTRYIHPLVTSIHPFIRD